MRIDLNPRTRSALLKRGGNLFIRRDAAGMLHASTKQPHSSPGFDPIEVGDVTLHIESGIPAPERWLITFSRFPWPHFAPLPDPVEADILESLPG